MSWIQAGRQMALCCAQAQVVAATFPRISHSKQQKIMSCVDVSSRMLHDNGYDECLRIQTNSCVNHEPTRTTPYQAIAIHSGNHNVIWSSNKNMPHSSARASSLSDRVSHVIHLKKCKMCVEYILQAKKTQIVWALTDQTLTSFANFQSDASSRLLGNGRQHAFHTPSYA